MSRVFGADFRDVRIHEGDAATRLGAHAYAQGSDLHFAPGRYAPGTPAGDELLGHELAHVVQQRAGRVAAPRSDGAPINDAPDLEAEADRLGALAASPTAAPATTHAAPVAGAAPASAGGPIQRDADPAAEASGEPGAAANTEANRVKQLEDDYAGALAARDWPLAGERLNAFNRDDIVAKLAGLPRADRAALHVGARDNPKVGPASQAAQLTRTDYLDASFDNERQQGHWEAAADYLDGFNDPDILSRVRRLDEAQRSSLQAAAAQHSRVVAAIETAANTSGAAATPAPQGQAPSAAGGFPSIIAKATRGPETIDGEQAWLLDGALWHALLQAIPGNRRNLGGIPIGGMTGWLHVMAKPALVAKFSSKPDGPNNTGLLTYRGNYLLWRHAVHHNHNPNGGPENTGTYDAMEAYKLTAEVVAKYEAKTQPKSRPGATGE